MRPWLSPSLEDTSHQRTERSERRTRRERKEKNLAEGRVTQLRELGRAVCHGGLLGSRPDRGRVAELQSSYHYWPGGCNLGPQGDRATRLQFPCPGLHSCDTNQRMAAGVCASDAQSLDPSPGAASSRATLTCLGYAQATKLPSITIKGAIISPILR